MSTRKDLLYISHTRYLKHDTGGGEHPEIAERLETISNNLRELADPVRIIERQAAPATRKQILKIHNEEYLLRFEETALSGLSYLGHPDNQLCYETYEIAKLAAGAGLTGIDRIEEDHENVVFCGVRPPGHHAEKALALGFCFLNNVAIAACYWQKNYGRKRIAIIDFDAHHGNGIQAAFEEDPKVLYISVHEHPTFSFPGTGYAEEHGSGSGMGATLNIPLLPGAGDAEVEKAFTRKIVPALDGFRPDALLIGAGFDGHRLDNMSGLAYSTELYRYLGHRISSLAEIYCGGRVVSILEGGYHLPSLGESFREYCSGLLQLP